MKQTGHNLIFLISQPRAGSTLTQRILGSHSQIHTQSEPWIMLHPLNALKSNNLQTSYDIDLYIKGARDFIDHLPGKMKYYQDTISEAYYSLYSSILNQENKHLFLDKTPRYYYIIEELSVFFPNAKFIFLWRNPAAVLSSIVKTWSKEDWYRLSEWKDDLLFAPQWMLSGISHLKGRTFVLKYEELLKNPAAIIKKVCKFLSVPFEENIIEYGQFKVPAWQYGDQVTVNQKDKPDISHADTWQAHLNNPQMWRVISDYKNYLGRELVSAMGYDFDEIEGLLEQNKPSIDIKLHTLPFNDLLNTNRSILIENRRLQKDLKNANDGLKTRDENLKMRNETIAQKDRLIAEKERIIQQSKIETSKMQARLEDKINQIDKQQAFISQKDKQIENLITELGFIAKTLSEKDLLLGNRNNEIASLKLTLKDKESLIKQLDSEVASLKLSLSDKESHVNQLGSEATSLKHSLKDIESLVVKMDSEITSLTNELELNKTNAENFKNQLSVFEDKLQYTEESKHKLNETILNQQKQIQGLRELIREIEQSYTFRLGKLLTWPVKKILNK